MGVEQISHLFLGGRAISPGAIILRIVAIVALLDILLNGEGLFQGSGLVVRNRNPGIDPKPYTAQE